VRNIDSRDGFTVQLGGDTLHPSHLLLATGKHEARGLPRAARPGQLVGFKTYFRLHPAQRSALSRHVELMVLPGGYAGLQLVEDGSANLSLLVHRQTLHRAGGSFDALLETLLRASPHLASRLNQAENLLAAPLAIARIPYGFIHKPSPEDPMQLFRLGDQAAVIESFTGDGMAIALHSATLAARYLLAGRTGPEYHRRLAADLSGQLRRAGILHRGLAAPALGPVLFSAASMFPTALAAAAALTRLRPSVRLAH
jgi:flavin-dependent dehydrogenase